MKTKLLSSILLILISAGFCKAQTQSLWATTLSSGNGSGEIFKINSDGSGFTDVYQFMYATGDNPYGNLIQASDGNIYGTTEDGGPSGSCVIFRYNILTNTYTDVHDFYFNDGYIPYSGLVEASGKLYGVTWDGGLNGGGVLYSYDIVTGIYTDEHDFTAGTGEYPWNVPVLGSDGKLYGITTQGGVNGGGVIFRFDPATNAYTDLYSLTPGADGNDALGSLYESSLDEKLYGTTSQGGANNYGTIFSFDLSNSTFVKLYDFATSGGSTPMATLTQGTNGLLYGTANAGGAFGAGVVFSFNPTTLLYNPMYHFSPANGNGTMPWGDLMIGANGFLYGTTSSGGINNNGTVFTIDPSTNILQVMTNFSTSIFSGSMPMGGLAVVNVPTGINESVKNNILDLYPNPAKNELHIATNKIADNTKFVLINSLGQEVLSWNENSIGVGYSKTIDVEKLDAGIYFLEMISDNSKTVEKFVKN